MNEYEIVRFRKNGKSQVVRSGVSIEEAREYCSRNDTSEKDWFDGFRKMR